jgi:mycothiol system anti-sigma-R factor
VTVDCDDCFERLYAFLDRELGEDEIVQVRKHLARCGHCEEHFIFERRFLEQIRDCCTSDIAPLALRERIVVRLRAERTSH